MQRGYDRRDRVVYRGPVSGTGEVLGDEDALKILDERVDPAEGELPDIGVVIERSDVEAVPAQGQQRLGQAEEWEKFRQTFRLIDELHGHRKPPTTITWAELPWTEGCMICEQSVRHPIVKAGLGTKLPLLIDTSWRRSPTMKDLGPSPDFPVRLRLMFGDSVFDLSVEPKDLDQPDLTLRDLLARATGLSRE